MEIEEVLRLIAGGENQRVEFKREIPKDIAKDICALANAEGGYIIIGVDDTGRIVGFKGDKKKIGTLLLPLIPKPDIEMEEFDIGGKKILVIKVEKSPKLVTIGGVAYIRIGTGRRPLELSELRAILIDSLEIEFDKANSGVPFREASKDILNWFFSKVKVKDKLLYLRSVQAIVRVKGKLYLTFGGLLFFHENPQDYLPNAGLRVVEVNKKGEPVRTKEFKGPVWRIVEDSVEYIKEKMEILEIIVGAERRKVYEYPVRAIREAITNAVVHRNYGIEADIRVFLYPDRIVVRSPGSLVPGVDLNDPDHIPRNPVLCTLMKDAGYIEKLGYGIRMMREECERHPFVEIEFRTSPMKFDVIFKKTLKSEEFDEIDKMILEILKNKELSSSQIAEKIGLSKPAVLNRLKRLISMGLVRAVGRGPRRKYTLS